MRSAPTNIFSVEPLTGKIDNPHDPSSRLIIRQPDDWHVHLRDGALLSAVVNETARQFSRAIVMPNLATPVTTVAAAVAYRERILAAVLPAHNFTPLMTLYLTDAAEPEEAKRGFLSGVFTAAKLYPAHATTNSAQGVTDITRIYPVLKLMEDLGMPLLLHGEVTDHDVDVFDREVAFIERVLVGLIARFPSLKIVFEHITTEEAVAFVETAGPNVGATITPHHLVINRNAMFEGGIRPHLYCLPVAKRERHRLALRRAATSGNEKFFLGTDSAPHAVGQKEADCGCAGIYNAPVALEIYATVFQEENALDKLGAFASAHGPHFYGLPLNSGSVVLERRPRRVPSQIIAAGTPIVPFRAGTDLEWTFCGRIALADEHV